MNKDMKPMDLNTVLDICVDRVVRGGTIESCLADYPEYSDELKPALEAAAGISCVSYFKVSDQSRREARKRLFDAIEKRHKPSFWAQFAAKAPAWGTVVSVFLIVAIGLVGLNSAATGSIPTVVATVPQPGISNFRFLVSDAPNDIADFSSLVVTVDHVAMLKKSGGDALVTFTPEVKQFDLVKLPGDLTQQLWQGNVPEGQYTRIELYVNEIVGTLKDGQAAEVKLPSDKLQISIPFVVGGDTLTAFTFDITANKTGEGSGKYILNPQAGDSGAVYEPKK
ncbi:DUF4382 domain-containing protein [Dehalogenimonas etheniformans]|uniref:DUF4382 domain-containing protein n=1 Tax=Dehalogenimonas etheniformans TaxID=1536648 RepID=A0A2P5P576_9CHLR|nr:DUF4382 domain-containing protein [Dehalogenimonas etheniformans]PPD57452.1 DUF4382 domain-containing protein [Dehalogenimonas etheniformans]QNT76815.1 DUF4382 domain-containing protein [Dehalogenimonas etheniformans]